MIINAKASSGLQLKGASKNNSPYLINKKYDDIDDNNSDYSSAIDDNDEKNSKDYSNIDESNDSNNDDNDKNDNNNDNEYKK